ncbi:MAG: DUF4126 domain-containing protein [Rhodocyclaceae bacterium]|nr:DUF4126 domain-containing protein [Rhodocyclaceae bacterium]MCP5240353.1 DUF4126 domain-containing protein [Zoogloeaceae bacterium]MCB1910397.1 DUF4126 domain-containing protein [Rhodocyclaceae bacterium]MCP5253538.1 DUF4126 domain-containing protein [Zoogloeaceae bacterium]MCP5294927.1 DUF4126 domain-containing protein [Zoogloeaceae bacterium]
MELDPSQLAASLEGLRPLLDWRDLPVDMASLTALAAGLGWASGLRLYALVFVLGALGRWGGVELPGGLAALTHPLVLGASGLMLVTEFFADKLPWLDSLWDSVHTFIRIPAGAALAAAVVGDHSGALQLAMGVMGGSLAAGTHFAKAGARAAINTSPEPFSNVAASLGEDALFAGGMWTLLAHPLWFLGGLAVFLVLAGLVIATMWRFIRRVLRPRARAADTG